MTTGTGQYKIAMEAARMLISIDNIEGAECKLDEARIIFNDLERDAERTISCGDHL